MLMLTGHYFEASNSCYCLQLVFQAEEITLLKSQYVKGISQEHKGMEKQKLLMACGIISFHTMVLI